MIARCLISTLPDASSMTQTNATVKFAIAAIPTTKTKSCIIRVLKTSNSEVWGTGKKVAVYY